MIRNSAVIKTLVMVVRHHHPYPVFGEMVHYFLLQDPSLLHLHRQNRRLMLGILRKPAGSMKNCESRNCTGGEKADTRPEEGGKLSDVRLASTIHANQRTFSVLQEEAF